MKKPLLLFSFALTAIVTSAQTIEYSQELLYSPYGDGLMVVRQVTHDGPNHETKTIVGDYKGIIVIPETVEGIDVVAIDDYAFKDCKELTEITIPASVTRSGIQAFYGCTSLKKLRLEDSDEEIIFIDEEHPYVTVRYWELAALEEVYVGRDYRYQFKNGESGIPFGEPFSHHSSIKSIVFGDKVTRINEGAFGWIHTLETVSFGAGLVTIESSAFQGSDQLTSSLRFPSSLKYIGEYAFYGTVVPEVIIPSSVDEICDYALNISTLKKVVFEDGETPVKLGAANFSAAGTPILEEAYIGRPVESEWPDLFHGNESLKKITIGDKVTSICASFCEGASLETLIIGSSVTSIGRSAFSAYWEESAKLNTIYCHAPTPPVCADANVFNNINKQTCRLYVPEGTVDTYKAADVWKDFFNVGISGINGVKADDTESDDRYTLSGQRAGANHRGIIIQRMSNGTARKILVR